MSAGEVALTRLLRRVRNSLWRWRAAASLWYGLFCSALVLLLSGLAQVLRGPVAWQLWLSLATAGPALAVLFAALRQRPGYAAAAAALDREGDYDDFFTSAWEASRIDPGRRRAGARAVLQQAAHRCGTTPVPPRWPSAPRRHGHFGFLPWALAVAGLFLLQLPAPPELPQPGPGIAARGNSQLTQPAQEYPVPAGERLPRGGASGLQPVPAAPVPEAQVARRPEPSADLSADGARLPDAETAGRAVNATGNVGANRADTGEKSAGEGIGNGAGSGGTPGEPAAGEALAGPAVQFIDLSRDGDGGNGTAGSVTMELEEGTAVSATAAQPTAAPVVTPPAAAAELRLFSPSQRLRIAGYFERIQELP